MDFFQYRGADLYCEDLSVAELAATYGTPLWIYSKRTLQHHLTQIQKAFAEVDPVICYSVKANPNLSLLKLLAKLGAGFDVVSGGELHRVARAARSIARNEPSTRQMATPDSSGW